MTPAWMTDLAPLWAGLALFWFGVWLLWPMRRQPLYSDDGIWLYYAVFRNRGLRLFENYKNGLSYFGVEWLMAALYRLCGRPGPHAFYDVKSVWYALTACALYGFGWLLSGEIVAPLAAGVTLLLLMANPRTKFALTFAEHMLLLPLLLAACGVWLGAHSGDWWWFAAAGALTGVATQMKIVGLLPVLALVVGFIWAPSFWGALGWYGAGFGFMNIVAPCLFLMLPKRCVLYLGTNLIGLLQYGQLALGVLGVRVRLPSRLAAAISMWLRTRVLGLPPKKEKKGSKYVEQRLGKSLKAVRAEFVSAFWPLMKQTALLWPVALAYVVWAAVSREPAAILLAVLFLSLWATQLVQKSYFPCHVNQIWPPLALMAALTLSHAAHSLLAAGELAGLIAIVLLVAVQWVALLVPGWRHRRETTLADYPEGFGARFLAARDVGEHIRSHSQPHERVLVWGNMPSVYIYAEREICMPRQFKKQMFTHIYPVKHGQVHAGVQGLLDHMRQAPPQWIVMFNPGVQDSWPIERIARETQAPYALHGVVETSYGEGKTLRVPVFRRNDDLLRDMLREQWRIDDSESAAQRFAHAFPDDGELALRAELAALPDDAARENHLRELTPDADHARFTCALLLAELHRDSGRLQAAREDFAGLVASWPESTPVLLGLAETLFMLGDVREALGFAQRAMRVNPHSAEACNDAGVMLHSVGETQQARQCFMKALQLAPDYAAARENMRQLVVSSFE